MNKKPKHGCQITTPALLVAVGCAENVLRSKHVRLPGDGDRPWNLNTLVSGRSVGKALHFISRPRRE